VVCRGGYKQVRMLNEERSLYKIAELLLEGLQQKELRIQFIE
jgi:hypothetical protein